MTSRRLALLLAVAALGAGVVLACGGSDAGDAPEGPTGRAACPGTSPLTHGPRSGAVTMSEALVWVRTCAPMPFEVEYKAASEGWEAAERVVGETQAERDSTGVAAVAGLTAATDYDYRIVIDGAPVEEAPAGSFRTMPERGGSVVEFLVGGDPHPEGQPLAQFQQLEEEDADFALLLGDLIDVEPFREDSAEAQPWSPEGKEDYERVYREVWGDTFFRSFMASTATFMMWDDHEIANDWDARSAPPYPFARQAVMEYMAMANPAPGRVGELYYTVEAGDAAFFVLDTRSFRDATERPDRAGKTMLGPQQKAALKVWLLGTDAKFKFIVSSVMFSNLAKHNDDAWQSYSAERREILNFVRDQGIDGVVLVSGDEHWSTVMRVPPWGIPELAASPLGGLVVLGVLPELEEVIYDAGWINAYGRYQIDTTSCPATLTFTITRIPREVMFEYELTEADVTWVPGLRGNPEEYCEALAAGRIDSDGDGCSDGQEAGSDPARGGGRDPSWRWDFYDTNGDRRVDFFDIDAVGGRLGVRSGDADYDPLLDRSAAPADDPLRLGPPDGVLDMTDFFAVIAQAGHTCAEG